MWAAVSFSSSQIQKKKQSKKYGAVCVSDACKYVNAYEFEEAAV